MKILLIDDHSLFRDGLIELISEKIQDVIFGEVKEDAELYDKLHSDAWDLVILDLNMPGRSGLEILKDVKVQYPNLPVLILSMYSENQFAVRVIKAGAAGYLTKGVSPGELCKAIKTVIEGKVYFTDEVAKIIAKRLKISEKPLLERLSDREIEILIMISSGKTLTEIATELSLSIKTVSTHRHHILEKLNLKNNIEISRFAIENSLIFY